MVPREVLDALNVAIFLVILTGVVLHKRRMLHVRLMIGCFCADMLMVLVIELQRSAIKQAVAASTPAMLRFHVAVSVAVVVLWFLQLWTGRAVLRGRPALGRHRVQAWLFLVCRLANVVTAFWVASQRA